MSKMQEGIVEWFGGKTVFVTGATGFMGKVLLEKLLRSCPDIKRIYILCRPKRGFSSTARVEEMIKLPLFEKLRKEMPSSLKKIVAIEGDILKKDLGLPEDIKQQLVSEVSVVFNGAASLRLEAGLKPAIENNTTGTEKILELSQQMNKLLAFVHLSTIFCHCEYDVLGEKVYPVTVSAKDIIQLVQWMDESILESVTPRILGPHPNCYTFSKRLAESLVNSYGNSVPVAIARPSIVTPAVAEPVPGWVDSLNGPVGVLVAGGKGLIRSMMVGENYNAEVVPVDVAINAIISIAWERGKDPVKSSSNIPVYNITNGDVQSITWGEVLEKGKKINYQYPFEAGLWYPNGTIRLNPVTHYLTVFFLQILPAYFIDFIFFILGQKTFMVRVQNRISVGTKVLQYFTTRQWKFENQNTVALTSKMNERDKQLFYVSNTNVDIDEYILNIILGARQFCMKEPLSTLPKARFQLRILYWLNEITKVAFATMMLWFMYRIFITSQTFRTIENYLYENTLH